jgi:predicted nucleic acid-binding protein
MKQYVLDASVILKWILYDAPEEQNVQQALALCMAFQAAEISVIQPLHWLAEVTAVTCRYRPQSARASLSMLYAMQINVIDTLDIYTKACELSVQLNHHLFDTLYHAVSLNIDNTVLITADEHYYNKAQQAGCIIKLADFSEQFAGE